MLLDASADESGFSNFYEVVAMRFVAAAFIILGLATDFRWSAFDDRCARSLTYMF
jgi:hypothetical protein